MNLLSILPGIIIITTAIIGLFSDLDDFFPPPD